MNRLTRYDTDRGLIVYEEERLLNANGVITKDEMYKIMRHLAEKLAEYEDLEERGKLLKLPVAVGDTVYVIPSKTNYKLNIINGYSENNRVYEQIVNRIEISGNGYLLITCDGMASVIDVFYKNTWFLSRESAEAALKEMSE